jgi:hypothetical protein
VDYKKIHGSITPADNTRVVKPDHSPIKPTDLFTSRSDILSNKVTEDKSRISFFENIHYWSWRYALKAGMRFPWRAAHLIATILIFSNAIVIAFTVFEITPVDNKDTKGFIGLTLLDIILSADLALYNGRNYCGKKNEYGGVIWDENYCILSSRYDNMTRGQKQKHKRTFWLYLTLSTVTSILFLYFLLS